MAIYPEDLDVRLGVDQIKRWIGSHIQSVGGEDRLNKLNWTDSREWIQRQFAQIKEFTELSSEEERPPFDFAAYGHLLSRLRMEGAYLEGPDLRLLAGVLHTLASWIRFLTLHGASFYELSRDWKDLTISIEAAREIEAATAPNGDILDGASKELADIRKRIQQVEKSARQALHSMLKQTISSEFSLEDSQVTYETDVW